VIKTESELDIHWLIQMAQDIREGKTPSLNTNQSAIDPDLAHPALSMLGDFVDRCGSDIEPAFLQGYAYGINQAGLIDDVVLKAIEMYVGGAVDNDLTSGRREH